MSWFTKLFINEAKPALDRHSGSGWGEDDTQAYILVDEDGNEYPAVLVSEETVFDATANDIREGKTAATEDGVTVGTKEIPAYITTEGTKIVTAGGQMSIRLGDGKHAYTKLLAVICDYNTNLSDSVAVSKSCINGNIYPVSSTDVLSTVTADDTTQSIDFGIKNDSESLVIIRYITYKEEY